MSKHKCTKELYKAFLQASSVRYSGLALSDLQASSVRYSGLALSEVSPEALSHDSVSRWLSSNNFRPREIWQIAEAYIHKDEECLLIADDTTLDKSRSEKIDLVHYQYSGNVHDVIAGIGLVNLLWYGINSQESVPIDYRVYDKDTDGKTKNEHFREMLKLAKQRGINPTSVVMDAWYASLDNLKAIRDFGWIWVAGLKKNRKVNHNEVLEKLEIPDEGLKLHLRGYGWITVFRFVAKNGRTDYIGTNMEFPTRDQVESITKARWSIEIYHRELKQTCGIERCQARTSRAQRNHIFLAIAAWYEKRRRYSKQVSVYQQHWDVIKESISKEMHYILATT